MVNIQNTIHSCMDDIVNHFLHAIHPLLINLIIAIQMLPPSNRYADSIEALFLHKCHQRCLGNGLSPGCLIFVTWLIVANPLAPRVKGIAQIPTQSHIMHCTRCTLLNIGYILINLIASKHERLTERITPPCIWWHTSTIPRHKPRPTCSGIPKVFHFCKLCIAICINTTFCQRHHLIRIASLYLTEFLFILCCRISIEITADNIHIIISRIPLRIGIILTGITIVVLRRPHPYKIMDSFFTEIVEHGNP